MDLAEVRRKGPREGWRDEDVLTSNVFGLLEFVRPSLCLLPWLKTARGLDDGDRLFSDTPEDAYETVCTKYWPHYPHLTRDHTEPDLVMSLKRPDQTADVLVVEVKYLSGLSGQGQLRREWGIVSISHEDAPGAPVALRKRALIYLTNDAVMPRLDMENEVRGAPDMRAGLYWLRWLDLMPIARRNLLRGAPHERRALERLSELLAARGMNASLDSQDGAALFLTGDQALAHRTPDGSAPASRLWRGSERSG